MLNRLVASGIAGCCSFYCKNKTFCLDMRSSQIIASTCVVVLALLKRIKGIRLMYVTIPYYFLFRLFPCFLLVCVFVSFSCLFCALFGATWSLATLSHLSFCAARACCHWTHTKINMMLRKIVKQNPWLKTRVAKLVGVAAGTAATVATANAFANDDTTPSYPLPWTHGAGGN